MTVGRRTGIGCALLVAAYEAMPWIQACDSTTPPSPPAMSLFQACGLSARSRTLPPTPWCCSHHPSYAHDESPPPCFTPPSRHLHPPPYPFVTSLSIPKPQAQVLERLERSPVTSYAQEGALRQLVCVCKHALRRSPPASNPHTPWLQPVTSAALFVVSCSLHSNRPHSLLHRVAGMLHRQWIVGRSRLALPCCRLMPPTSGYSP